MFQAGSPPLHFFFRFCDPESGLRSLLQQLPATWLAVSNVWTAPLRLGAPEGGSDAHDLLAVPDE